MKTNQVPELSWWWRVWIGALLVAWIGVPYLVLQRVEWRPVTVLRWDPLTRAVPFQEWSVWVYVSFYPFLAWAALGCRKCDFMAYVWTCALAAAIAHLVFLLWPTEVPRPVVYDAGLLYDWLRQVDRPRNAFPSLHVALSVPAAIVLWRRHRGWIGWGASLWAAAIIGSTLALRQHVAVDVVAGGGLGAGCWWLVRRVGGRFRPWPPGRAVFGSATNGTVLGDHHV